jgi:hypothetical protein
MSGTTMDSLIWVQGRYLALLSEHEAVKTDLAEAQTAARGLQQCCEAQRAALADERQRLRRLLPMDCPECGPMVVIDEDGCCVTCGADATDSRGKDGAK